MKEVIVAFMSSEFSGDECKTFATQFGKYCFKKGHKYYKIGFKWYFR